jgi:hypothetical protein
MKIMNLRRPRIAGLLALALGAVALLALSGVATAKDRGGDDHGHHGRHHHNHFREIEQAGTISSFDQATGRLTIALTGGETVSGLVTDETRIRCEGTDDRRADRRDHGGGDDNESPEAGETPSCTTAALVPGAFVGEAELRLGTGTATFEEVELGHDS